MSIVFALAALPPLICGVPLLIVGVEQTFGSGTLPGDGGISQVMTTWLRNAPAVNARLADIPTPFGDGTASSNLIQAIRSRYGEGCPRPSLQVRGS